MSYKIEQVEGIRKAYASKLIQLGIHTTDELLDRAATEADRAKLFDESAIPMDLIVKWTNHADLMRLTGVDGHWAELLDAAGVKNVQDLRDRDAADLYNRMKEINEKEKLASCVPSLDETGAMIAEAKTMETRVR